MLQFATWNNMIKFYLRPEIKLSDANALLTKVFYYFFAFITWEIKLVKYIHSQFYYSFTISNEKPAAIDLSVLLLIHMG